MMRNGVTLFFAVFLLLNVAEAQVQRPLDPVALATVNQHIYKNDQKLKEISSPVALAKSQIKGIYLDPLWTAGVVYAVSGEVYYCPARFNIHRNRIEIKTADDMRVLHPVAIHAVKLDAQVFIPLTSDEKNDGTSAIYFEVLSGGDHSLLKKYSLSLHTTGGTALHTNLGSGKEYRQSSALYYAHKGQNAQRLKTGKKSILKLMEEHQAALTRICRKHRPGIQKGKRSYRDIQLV